MRSIFLSCSSENFVVKKATASAMNAPAATGASVVNRAKGSSAIMLHHLQGIHNLTFFASARHGVLRCGRVQVRRRVLFLGQRREICLLAFFFISSTSPNSRACIGHASTQMGILPRQRAQRSVALHAMALFAIDTRSVVRASHVAVTAADALVGINRDQARFGIFVHGGCRAHFRARRIVAMVASHRRVVRKRVRRPAAIGILLPRAVAHFIHAAIPELFAQIMVVGASQLAGFAAGAALTMEKERFLSHPCYPPYAFST